MKPINLLSPLLRLALLSCVAVAPSHKLFSAEDLAAPTGSADPAFTKHMSRFCFDCHGADNAEADLDLEVLLGDGKGLRSRPDVLESVRQRIIDEEMPPIDAAQPTAPSRRAILAALDSDLKELRAQLEGDPGDVVMPRINRDEYRNVMRDLSGGIVSFPAERYFSAPTRAGEGFANVGAAQGMTLGEVESYLDASRAVLQHLRVSPAGGFSWSENPGQAIEDAKQWRAELLNETMKWFTSQQSKQAGDAHFSQLEEAVDMTQGAYFEAMWRYRFRDQLGMPDATLNDIAKGYEVRLYAEALRRWWRIIHEEDLPPILDHVVEQWKAIPSPDEGGGRIVRSRCRELLADMDKVTSDFTLNEAPTYEISLYEEFDQRAKETLRRSKKEGWMDFELLLGDTERLYLVVTDAWDGGEDDVVLWHKGRFHYSDGTTTAWQESVASPDVIDPVSGETSGQIQWGSFLGKAELPTGADEWTGPDEQIDAKGAFAVRAPKLMRIEIPDGAERFTVEVRIHEQLGKDSSLQTLVLRETEKLEGDWAITFNDGSEAPNEPPTVYEPWMVRFYPWRHIFGHPDSEKTGPAYRDYRTVRIIERRNKYKLGKNAERSIFSGVEGLEPKWLGGPWDDQDLIEDNPDRPFEISAERVKQGAGQQARRELERLYKDLKFASQPPHQKLARFLQEQGVEEVREGRLPDADFAADWKAEARQKFQNLRIAVISFESRLAEIAAAQLRAFARRAWRRPISSTELDDLVETFQAQRAAGATYDTSMKVAMRVVLASPNFIYRAQQTRRSADPYQLNDYELASRLSFFLWSSIPDDRLLTLAEQGRLADPKVLKAEARRMLADPKAEALATQFAGRWLGFAGFDGFTGPNDQKFPEFTPELREAMYREAVMFFRDLFENNLPVTGIVDADYTFLNELLARHYGIDGVEGSGMRKVELGTNRRGGILGMGSVLTATSKPLRTSPVNRGVWVLEQVMGRSLPDPPADVPEISEEATNSDGLTVTQQLALHRESAMCSACHVRIDPLGLTLQNFDPIGRWRDQDPAGETIDATGTLAAGKTIAGLAGLKEYLQTSQRDQIIDTFCRKLTGYALGRAVGAGDARLLDEMKRRLADQDYRFASALDAILESPQFLNRRDGQEGIQTASN